MWPNPWCRNLPTNRRKMLVGPISEAFHSWLDQYLDMIKAGEDWNFELKVHTWTCTKIIAENDSDEIRTFLHSLASESVSILFWQITGLCHHVFWKVGLVVQNQKLWSNMTDRWFKPCWVCRKLFLVQVTVVWKWLLNTGESYLEIIPIQKNVVFSCHILWTQQVEVGNMPIYK